MAGASQWSGSPGVEISLYRARKLSEEAKMVAFYATFTANRPRSIGANEITRIGWCLFLLV